MRKLLKFFIACYLIVVSQTVFAADCDAWSASVVYNAGDKVCYNNQGYELVSGAYSISGDTYSPEGSFGHLWQTITDCPCSGGSGDTYYFPNEVNQTGENMKVEGDVKIDGEISIMQPVSPGAVIFTVNAGEWRSEYSGPTSSHSMVRPGRMELVTTMNGKSLIHGGDITTNGTITTSEIVVTETPAFPDYVFEKDYKLASLEEIETYVNTNKHLPGIPTAKEVKENGLNMGELQVKLVEKIEELTLQMIKMQKRINELESK